MANLVVSEEEVMLVDAARGWLDGAAPVSALRALRDGGRSHDPALWSEMAAMGWAGVLIPEEAGGAGMGHTAAALLAREMGRTLVASPFLSTAVIAATALKAAGGAQEKLARIAAGEVTYAFALDEGRKFDPATCRLDATRHGNGFRLSGTKVFVADGGLADRLLVLARTGDGLTLFDLPADRAGIARDVRPMIDARDAATVTFSDVEATGDEVLGQVDDAMTVAGPAIRAGQSALAAELTGLASGAFEMTLGYLKERQQFGRPIGSFQALQHRAAHLWCEIEITTSAVLNAGRMLDEAPDDADLAVSLAKARATGTATLAVQEGVQMHGGIGMTDDFDMGFYMKRARVGAEWLGDYGYHAARVAAHRGF